MIQIITPILVALSVLLIGGSIMLARRSRQDKLAARLNFGNTAVVEPPRPSAIIQGLDKLGHITSGGKTSHTLREELARAGFHNANASAIFLGCKAGMFLIAVLANIVISGTVHLSMRNMITLGVIICGLALFLPNLALNMRRTRRRREIARYLPDAIDLLEISVTAGMGMDQAWNAVADHVRGVSPTLADEMALTNLEMHLGAGRPEAMRHMAERTGAAELGSLVACLIQAERFGTSIQQALRNFAAGMRETRSQRAQENAEKMAVKLLFPMIALVFPPAVMVMAGPALLSLFRALAGAGS